MSATLQADQFSTYFNNAKVLCVQGRQYPVQVITCIKSRPLLLHNFIQIYYSPEPQQDYVHAAIVTVLQVHQQLKDQLGLAW